MLDVTVEIKIDPSFMKALEEASVKALEQMGDAIKSDLVLGQTMPFDTGNLQNDSTYVDVSDDEVRIISSTPYARRLYFHPEYNFRMDKNPNAGGRWFDQYLEGHEKGDMPGRLFADFLKKGLGR